MPGQSTYTPDLLTQVHIHTHIHSGDFVILLSTGMRWRVALLLNLLSQVTGIVAFFIGVAISTNSKEANGWILTIAAGVFLYISLVDLVRQFPPLFIHCKYFHVPLPAAWTDPHKRQRLFSLGAVCDEQRGVPYCIYCSPVAGHV